MHFTPWPFWLRIVSIATVVLPVLRSPMISSRWPRPIGRHRVDGLDAGLQRLVHGLAADDAGRLHLEAALPRCCAIGPLPSIGLTERVDDAAEQRVADRHREDAAGRLDRAALLDVVGLAEDDRADRVLVEVQREAERAALELEQLVDRRCRAARRRGRCRRRPRARARPAPASSAGVNVPTCLRSAAAISSALMVSSAIAAADSC